MNVVKGVGKTWSETTPCSNTFNIHSIVGFKKVSFIQSTKRLAFWAYQPLSLNLHAVDKNGWQFAMAISSFHPNLLFREKYFALKNEKTKKNQLHSQINNCFIQFVCIITVHNIQSEKNPYVPPVPRSNNGKVNVCTHNAQLSANQRSSVYLSKGAVWARIIVWTGSIFTSIYLTILSEWPACPMQPIIHKWKVQCYRCFKNTDLRNTDVVRHCSLMWFHDGDCLKEFFNIVPIANIYIRTKHGRKFLISPALWRSVSFQFLHHLQRKLYTNIPCDRCYFKMPLR